MKLLISAALIAMCGCAGFGTTIVDVLKACGVPAAEAEAGQLYGAVLAIVDQQPVNWQEQLQALEKNFKTGVLCALQQIANEQVGTAPTAKVVGGASLFAYPSSKASTNARIYLSAHQ